MDSKKRIIDGIEISLREPDITHYKWIGRDEEMRFLLASWLQIDKEDLPMTPVLVGDPGNGKTTLACASAQEFNQPAYLMNCTSDMRPEDLIVTPVISSGNQIKYRGSPLVSAVINGGVCVLDEANRMNEKCWASLAPLLDDRRYVESVIAGVKIKAHSDFRFVATMNDDPSTYTIPGYIESRLKPVIEVEPPSGEVLRAIVKANVPYASEDLIESVIQHMLKDEDAFLSRSFSIRDAIEVTRYAVRLSRKGEDYQKSFEYIMKTGSESL
ncbi:MAG: replication factor C large subunit [Methanobacterium sp. PtaB.Bin024]|nr:MAG: replication factor C large subunit [Methanobacterium sp. PtaB.Bin024]